MKKSTQTTLGLPPPKRIRDTGRENKGNVKFFPVENKTFEGIIEELETIHNRTNFYSLFSGGKDSMTTTHKLADIGKLKAVVHIKTNIGLQMTTDFVKDICQEQGWKLYLVEPIPKFTYASHVLQYGFPGPTFHRQIMGRLKYKTMRNFAFSIDKKNHCLISGIRKFESKRRMGNYLHPIQSQGSLWFGSPIFYDSTEYTYKYVHENGLKISPAYKLGLGMSGECLCGAFAGKGEKLKIRELDPILADYIEWLEDGVQRFGTKEAKRYPKWGEQAKMSELEEQQQMDLFFKENPDLKIVDEMESLVCGVECGAGTMRGMLDY